MKRFGLVVLVALAMIDCGGGDGGGPPVITAVLISGDSTVVLAGTRQLTATAMAGGSPLATGVTFQWSSTDTTRATVTSSGLVSGVRLGSSGITARAVLNGTPTNVSSGAHGMRTRIGAITLTPPAPQFAALHDTIVVTAEARDALNAVVPGVAFTWLSRSPSVATAADSGVHRAVVAAQANGTARIVATGDGVSDSVTVTVQQVAVTLAVSPDTVTFGRIDSVLTPVVTANDARGNPIPASAVSWNSLNPAVAAVNPTTGAITSKNEPSTRVIATSGTLSDTVRVGVALVYASAQITVGGFSTPIDSALITRLSGTFQLGVVVRDAGNTIVPNPQGVAWSLKNGTIATIGAGSGLITGNTTTGRDSVIVAARTARDTIALVVRQDVSTVDVTPASPADLNFVGDTQTFAATAFDGGGAPIPGKAFAWSTNNAILSVNAAGFAQAVGRSSQTGVLVHVRATTDGVTDSSAIRVRQIPTSANLNPNSFSTLTAFGQQVSASCVVFDSAGDTIPSHVCGWSAVPDSGVVTFSPVNAVTTTITARKNGDANIRATAFPSIFAPNFVQVQQEPASVALTPTTLDTSRILTSTGTMRFIASVLDANDSLIQTPPPAITWSSTAAFASVDGTGLVTAGASAGTTFIKAESGAFKDSAIVVVTATPTTLSGSVQPLLDVSGAGSCASCHTGGGPSLPSSMNLTTALNTRSNTVNVQAVESGLRRVLPSRPDSSYFVHKVQGTHLGPPANGSGVRMPAGGTPLTRGQINIIRNWILQGALNN